MKEDDIGKLYQQKFEHFEVPVGPQEWAFIETGVDKVNFYSFTAHHFNVYYLAAANLIVGSAVSVAVYKYTDAGNSEGNNPDKKEIIQPVIVKEKTDSTIHLYDEDNRQEKVQSTDRKYSNDLPDPDTKKQASLLPDADSSTSVNSIPTTETKIIPKDTVSVLPKVAPKKVVYINKRDTIVVRDTLDGPPKKRKKK